MRPFLETESDLQPYETGKEELLRYLQCFENAEAFLHFWNHADLDDEDLLAALDVPDEEARDLKAFLAGNGGRLKEATCEAYKLPDGSYDVETFRHDLETWAPVVERARELAAKEAASDPWGAKIKRGWLHEPGHA